MGIIGEKEREEKLKEVLFRLKRIRLMLENIEIYDIPLSEVSWETAINTLRYLEEILTKMEGSSQIRVKGIFEQGINFLASILELVASSPADIAIIREEINLIKQLFLNLYWLKYWDGVDE